jgi:hypothetical protein
MVEFGEDLEWTFVMGGLAREYGPADHDSMVRHWLEASDETGMPTDPLAWFEAPLTSTYPACRAVKAAQEQGRDAAYRYLRALREGIVCRRRKLDTAAALVDEARRVGLDVERFRRDLAADATAEAFEADLEESRDVPDVARQVGKVRCSADVGEERVPFPTLRFEGPDGKPHWTCGMRSLEYVREAALTAGAAPANDSRPSAIEAIRRFGPMATVEVAAVCGLSLTDAEAELAGLARDARLQPVPVLAGRLWELA